MNRSFNTKIESGASLDSPKLFASPSDRTTASLLKKPTKETSSDQSFYVAEPTNEFLTGQQVSAFESQIEFQQSKEFWSAKEN